MKVKICGLTNLQDTLLAVEAGADMLGFNFYPASPRCLTIKHCAQIQDELERRGMRIPAAGIFVNHTLEEIRSTISACGLDYAQLSGDEPVSLLRALPGIAYKALRQTGGQIETAHEFVQHGLQPALLIDAHQPGSYGGTGKTADWKLANTLAEQYPLLLAGGLTVENVRSAITAVNPWGVDVASGVELQPGRKDPAKLTAFIINAHAS